MTKLIGSEEPRIYTPPLRPLTPETSLGFAAVEFAEEVISITLLPWERWFFIHALELLSDGSFRYRTILLLVARQNGKSLCLQILALFFMYVQGAPLVIGTAQNLDIAEEVWQGAVDIAEGCDELADEIADVARSNGKKSLMLRTKERYKVAAASRKGGRGLSGDFVMLDELREHTTWDAWGAVTKTTMARAKAIVLGASNAGDKASIVLAHLRYIAHLSVGNPDGLEAPPDNEDDDEDIDLDDDSVGIFEWSATPGLPRSNPEGWKQANPSLGYTITERAIRSALRTDPEWVFRTEVLCQWWEGSTEEPQWEVVGEDDWDAGARTFTAGFLGPPYTYAVEVTPDRKFATIAAAGEHPDGVAVEVGEHRPGTAWVVERLAELVAKHKPKGVLIDPRSPAGPLIRDLVDEHGIEVTEVNGSDYAKACTSFADAAGTHQVIHHHQDILDTAVGFAAKKAMGDTWKFDRRSDAAPIAPLSAAALARWGHLEIEAPPPTSIYESRGAVVL